MGGYESNIIEFSMISVNINFRSNFFINTKFWRNFQYIKIFYECRKILANFSMKIKISENFYEN